MRIVCIFSFLFFWYITFVLEVLWPFLDIHCTYLFIYIDVCFSFTYTFMCCFFSPFIHMFLILVCTHMFLILVCNLLFLFYTKMPWWVLFKVFQKYRLLKSTCHELSSYKVFSRVYVRIDFIVFNRWIWVEWFMTSLIRSFVCCGFVTDCQRGRLLGHMFHLLRTYVMILYNWLILWQNALYLYLGRFRMCLNTLRNFVSRSSIEAFKTVQENKFKVQNH